MALISGKRNNTFIHVNSDHITRAKLNKDGMIQNLKKDSMIVQNPSSSMESLSLDAISFAPSSEKQNIEDVMSDTTRKALSVEQEKLKQEQKGYLEAISLLEEKVNSLLLLGRSGALTYKEQYEQYQRNLMNLDSQLLEKIEQYQIYCSDEKLKELGLTNQDLQAMTTNEWLQICKEKDSYYLNLLENIALQKQALDQRIKEETGCATYEDYLRLIQSIKIDLATLKAALYQTEQFQKTAKYDLLIKEIKEKQLEKENLEEEIVHQNLQWNGITYEIDYSTYQAKGGTLSPLAFLKQAKEKYPTYEIKVKNQELLEYLSIYGKEDPTVIQLYDYLYQQGGEILTEQYLEDIEATLNNYIGKKRAQEFLSTLTKKEDGNYNYEDIFNHMKVTGKGILEGTETFREGLINFSDLALSLIGLGEDQAHVYSRNEYESMYILQALQENQEKLNLLDNNYEISQSIGNMIPSMAIGVLTTPLIGSVTMGTSAGGESYHQALVKGYDKGNAIFYGVLSGLSETTLEYVLGGIPGLSNFMDEGSAMSIKAFSKRMLSEGIEEGSQEYIDALLNTGLFGQKFDLEEVNQNALKSGIYGALTAGILNHSAIGIQTIENTLQVGMQSNHFKEQKVVLNGRLKAMLEKGYDLDTIQRLSSFTQEEVKEGVDILLLRTTLNCTPTNHPHVYFIGGQPGSGKSSAMNRVYQMEKENGVANVEMDAYRMMNPKIDEIRKTIYHFYDDLEVENKSDAMSRDLVALTQNYADAVADQYALELFEKGYNMAIESTLRHPESKLEFAKELREKNPDAVISVIMMGVSYNTAMVGAINRAKQMDICLNQLIEDSKQRGIEIAPISRGGVNQNFYDGVCHDLPESIGILSDTKYQSILNGNVQIQDRTGSIHYDRNRDGNRLNPKEIQSSLLFPVEDYVNENSQNFFGVGAFIKENQESILDLYGDEKSAVNRFIDAIKNTR